MNDLYGLEVLVELSDRMSGGLSRIIDSLNIFDGRMTRTDSGLDRLQGAMEHVSGVGSSAMQSLANHASRAFDSVRSGASGLMHGLQSLTSGIFNLPNLMMGSLAALAGKSVFDALGFKEQNLISFEVMLGGVDAAQKVLGQLQRFAAITPFETPEVIGAGKAMMAFGFSVDELIPKMTTAGNLAAGMNVPLGDVVSMFGRLKSGGFGEAFERLRDFGISRQLLEMKGLQFNKGGSYIGSVENAMSAVTNIIDTRFGGMIDKQSQSLFGLVSTLASRPFELFSSIDVSLEGPLKGVRSFLSRLSDLTDFSKAPGSLIVEQFGLGMTKIFDAFGFAANGLKPEIAENVINRVLDVLRRVSDWVATYGPQIVQGVNDFATGFMGGLNKLKEVFSPIISGVDDFLDRIKGLSGGLSGVNFASLAGGASSAVAAFTSLNVATGGLLESLIGLGGQAALQGIQILATGGNPLIALSNAFGGLRLGVLNFTGAVRVMGMALLTNPITWVIAGVIALGAAFVWAWNNVKEFREGFMSAIEPLTDAWGGFLEILGQFGETLAPLGGILSGVFGGFQNVLGDIAYGVGFFLGFVFTGFGIVFGRIGQIVLSGLGGILNIISGVIDGIVGFFTHDLDKARSGVNRIFAGIAQILAAPFEMFGVDWSEVQKTLENCWSWASGFITRFIDLGGNIVKGIAIGIMKFISEPVQAIVNVANALSQAFTGATKQKSPSLLFAGFGSMLGAGLAIGILDSIPDVTAATNQLAVMPRLEIQAPLIQTPVMPDFLLPKVTQGFDLAPRALPDLSPPALTQAIDLAPRAIPDFGVSRVPELPQIDFGTPRVPDVVPKALTQNVNMTRSPLEDLAPFTTTHTMELDSMMTDLTFNIPEIPPLETTLNLHPILEGLEQFEAQTTRTIEPREIERTLSRSESRSTRGSGSGNHTKRVILDINVKGDSQNAREIAAAFAPDARALLYQALQELMLESGEDA